MAGWWAEAGLSSYPRGQSRRRPCRCRACTSAERGTILFPEGAEVQRLFPDRKKLEEAGLEIYEFTADGLNLRWRVRRDDVLYLG